jgi:para-aminobenzoate synthetase component 1
MISRSVGAAPFAYFGGMLATDLVEVADLSARPEALDRGWWAVCATFEGAVTGHRFASVRRAPLPPAAHPWPGVDGPWRSSLSRGDYERGVDEIRRRIARGDVYQVNLCRLLTAEMPGEDDDVPACFDPLALAHLLAAGNPARYQGVLATGDDWLVTASPELFLRRDGDVLRSAPIKGTAGSGEPFASKDTPENVMICDLVRNDLGRIAHTGSVQVEALLAREELPGLAHLVSTVRAVLRPGVGWGEILAAMFPPGSVSGAPKLAALQVISELEPAPRGPYCGAIGFVDGDAGVAELAVGIRTFYTSRGGRRLHFGTGAGITYLSDPAGEWAETELKAARLIALAGQSSASQKQV